MEINEYSSYVHWNYYIALEQDLSKISRYIEFHEDNFNTYSIELAHLFLTASAEVDVVLKLLCNLKNKKTHNNINAYKKTISEFLPELINARCFINRYSLELQPWQEWNKDANPLDKKSNPSWWKSYNNVKHNRDKSFKEANLKNTLYGVAALGLVTHYYYREVFSALNAHTHKDTENRLRPSLSLIEFV